METNERLETDGEEREPTPQEVGETLPAVANEPVAPKAMSIEEVQEAQRKAEELVKELGAATGGAGITDHSFSRRILRADRAPNASGKKPDLSRA